VRVPFFWSRVGLGVEAGVVGGWDGMGWGDCGLRIADCGKWVRWSDDGLNGKFDDSSIIVDSPVGGLFS
jgi:hypothetical protein